MKLGGRARNGRGGSRESAVSRPQLLAPRAPTRKPCSARRRVSHMTSPRNAAELSRP